MVILSWMVSLYIERLTMFLLETDDKFCKVKNSQMFYRGVTYLSIVKFKSIPSSVKHIGSDVYENLF